jgi:DNA-binding MarR family transcriptional regulator
MFLRATEPDDLVAGERARRLLRSAGARRGVEPDLLQLQAGIPRHASRTRKPLASLGLTAARFDLLYALLSREGSDLIRYGTRQSELRGKLGVCASVVSRMLASLEAVGWVTRRRLQQGSDRRQCWVMLTAGGRQRIAVAFKMLRRTSWRLVHQAICFGKHRDTSSQFVHTSQVESYRQAMRSEYGDTATLIHPWHPDD